jgi:hypothetical protein
VRLPTILDEPFGRLDGHATAAVAAVLDAFSRDGHQVLLFTSQPIAIDRLESLGATFFNVVDSRRWNRDCAASLTNGAACETRAASVDSTLPASALKAVLNPTMLAEVTGAKRRQKRSDSPPRVGTRRRNRGDAA